jgi:hypothetical protein
MVFIRIDEPNETGEVQPPGRKRWRGLVRNDGTLSATAGSVTE